MILDAQACLGRPANPALLDQKDLRERLAHWVVLALSASLGPLAHQESVVCLACLGHLVLLDDKESVENLENPGQRVSEVMKVPLARLVCLAPLVPWVPQVKVVLPALTESPDPLALLVEPETRVLLDPLGARAVLVHPVYLVPLVPEDP